MVDKIIDSKDINVLFRLEQNPREEVLDLVCSPMVLHVKTGDRIIFESENHKPFSVISKGQSPLEQVEIRSKGDSVPVKVREDAVPGVYSFACALFSENHGIFMDAGCPDLIVDPGRRGSG